MRVYACHCLDCQRATSSAFSISVSVPGEAFQVSGKELQGVFGGVTDGGRTKTRWVCADCGVCLCGGVKVGTEPPGYVRNVMVRAPSRSRQSVPGSRPLVRAGTLDDTSWVRPTIHMYARTKQPWMIIPDGSVVHTAGPWAIAAPIHLAALWATQRSKRQSAERRLMLNLKEGTGGPRCHRFGAWIAAFAVAIGLGPGAQATSTFCAVVKETEDGFVALRDGPSVNHRMLLRLVLLEIVLVDTGQCRGDVCSYDGKWLVVEGVPRKDGMSSNQFTRGWVRSSLVRQAACPE